MPHHQQRIPTKLDDVAVMGLDHTNQLLEQLVQVEGEPLNAHVTSLFEEVFSEGGESGDVDKHDDSGEGLAEGFGGGLTGREQIARDDLVGEEADDLGARIVPLCCNSSGMRRHTDDANDKYGAFALLHPALPDGVDDLIVFHQPVDTVEVTRSLVDADEAVEVVLEVELLLDLATHHPRRRLVRDSQRPERALVIVQVEDRQLLVHVRCVHRTFSNLLCRYVERVDFVFLLLLLFAFVGFDSTDFHVGKSLGPSHPLRRIFLISDWHVIFGFLLCSRNKQFPGPLSHRQPLVKFGLSLLFLLGIHLVSHGKLTPSVKRTIRRNEERRGRS